MRFAMADDARDGLIDGDVAGNNLSTTTTTGVPEKVSPLKLFGIFSLRLSLFM